MLLPNTTVINYKYDALGRRVERSKANGMWTRYGYDGLEVLRDVNSDGSTVEYVNGDELDDHLWQRKSDGTTHYFLTDHQGSTCGLTDGSGAVTASYSYDTFGNGFSSSLTRFGYTGREHDAETGLLYYRARWYDPGQGRFVSEYPLGFDGGINMYGYVDNDPSNWVDPLGENKFRFLYGKFWPNYKQYLPDAFKAVAGTNFVTRKITSLVELTKTQKIWRLRKEAADSLCKEAKEYMDKGYQVHHDFVQKHRDKFKDLGIDIDHPSVTRWVDPKWHRKWSKELEKRWDDLFDEFGHLPADKLKKKVIDLYKDIRDVKGDIGSSKYPSMDPPTCP